MKDKFEPGTEDLERWLDERWDFFPTLPVGVTAELAASDINLLRRVRDELKEAA